MMGYENSYIGFIKDVAEIIQELGIDWEGFGKKEYAKGFLISSRLLFEVMENLEFIKTIFDKEQTNEPPI